MNDISVLNNRYHLEERQGSGGMATVYRAHDLNLDRTVAIKILKKDFSHDMAFRERFHQEAKAAARLSHPNIVTVYDFGLDADQLFIVMEYIPGVDLKTTMRQNGRLSIEETLELITQACAGLGHAHQAGLVHCDVKPQNMLVTPDRRLKVVDFGIARALATISPDEQSEIVWGSPQYFSPEQAAGSAPSPASDVYSLGVMMFEMLTGQLPFISKSPEELARLHRESPPPAPRSINPAIPFALEQILYKALSKESSLRYPTADQFGRALTNYVDQQRLAAAFSTPRASYSSASPTPRQRPEPMTTVLTSGGQQPGYSTPHTPPPAPAPGSNPVQLRAKPRLAATDWFTWILAVIALILGAGLIPFWLWIFYNLNLPF